MSLGFRHAEFKTPVSLDWVIAVCHSTRLWTSLNILFGLCFAKVKFSSGLHLCEKQSESCATVVVMAYSLIYQSYLCLISRDPKGSTSFTTQSSYSDASLTVKVRQWTTFSTGLRTMLSQVLYRLELLQNSVDLCIVSCAYSSSRSL